MGSELEPLPRVSKVGKRALALDGVDDEEVIVVLLFEILSAGPRCCSQ